MRRRPLLFMDVDGVLALWDPVVDVDRVRPAGVAGVPLPVPVGTLARLQRLAGAFEMVWATAWGDDAPQFLAPCLGIGGDWPVLEFGLDKWVAVCDYAAGRPFAWVDDEPEDEGRGLGARGSGAHLVVHADHRVGLDDDAVVRLLTFADLL